MELVIEVDDIIYKETVNSKVLFDEYISEVTIAIINGTPLPKGHGNLIDYDDLIAKLDRYGRKNVKYQLPYSPTIIFADKDRK
jgi:hypothetical protein